MLARRRSKRTKLALWDPRAATAVVVVAKELPGDEDVEKYKNQVAEFHVSLV